MTALLDTGDIARILGVSRKHATGRITKAPGFPAPAINLSRRVRRWKHNEVMAYLKAGRQSPRATP